MSRNKRLWDQYRFPGFEPGHTVKGIFGDPGAWIIHLERRQKKQFAVHVGEFPILSTIERFDEFETFPAERRGFTWRWRSGESIAASAKK